MFHINYKTQDILLRFVRHGRGVGTDEIQEFEEAIERSIKNSNVYEDPESSEFGMKEKRLIEEASFEDLLDLARGNMGEDSLEDSITSSKESSLIQNSKASVVADDLRRKERKVVGLDR